MGYWGRHHGDDDGTPPDNFTRTASGVYPAGGRFDDNPDVFPYDGVNFPAYDAFVGLGLGGGGQGIEPIILSSYVDFWRAEASLALGNTGDASMYFESGITKSIAKVQTFGSLDATADLSVAADAARVATFIAEQVDNFDDADTDTALDGNGWPVEKSKWDILGEQYFIAMFGGAADAFNYYRRVGGPRTLGRNQEENSGDFPRTVLYPSSEIIANPNIQQRTDLSTLVFWDSGTTNPAN